jgi:2-keto-4-pentenoate hydratase/2-oxohepta-3-ene-1,7-dioic acid hydratase in catechol pathway
LRICRFRKGGGAPSFGVIDPAAGTVRPLAGDPFGSFDASGNPVPLSEVRLLAPVLPSKIVAVGLNYRDHAKEMGKPFPPEPLLFLKAPSALNDPEGEIVYPPDSSLVHYEAELAVVVGKRAKGVPAERAGEHILGYCCLNDVTARDLQRRDGLYARAKGFDTFCPLGPWIETELDPSALSVLCRVNGALRQDGNTREMGVGPLALLAFVSRVMTLEPGDVIATGTPPGVGALEPGDTVEVEIEGIGVLRNRVVPS